MNTKLLMTVSSVLLAIAGAVLLFAPAEFATALGLPGSPQLSLLIQLAGVLYLAFALNNWTAKGSIIGGIYSRPLSLGNLFHFMAGALAIFKYALAQGFQWVAVVVLVVYASFALLFSYVVFGHSPGPSAGPSKEPAP